jgi:AcrR family transcriptional regulator
MIYEARDKGQATQGRLMEAAIRLFSVRGVDAISMRDIAAEVGVSEPAVYRHFHSKAELLRGIFVENYGALGEAMDARQAAAPSFDGKIAAMVGECCRLFDADEALFRFLLLIERGQLPAVPKEVKTPVNVVRGVIAAAAARGEIPAIDPELATAAFFGLVTQPAVFLVYGRLGRPLAAHAPRIAAMARAALDLLVEEANHA